MSLSLLLESVLSGGGDEMFILVVNVKGLMGLKTPSRLCVSSVGPSSSLSEYEFKICFHPSILFSLLLSTKCVREGIELVVVAGGRILAISMFHPRLTIISKSN